MHCTYNGETRSVNEERVMGRKNRVSQYEHSGANVVRTLVIDGVANREDTEDGGKDRSSRRVLSGEVPRLQSPKACLRSWPLGELGVKVDERREVSSGSSRLKIGCCVKRCASE